MVAMLATGNPIMMIARWYVYDFKDNFAAYGA
jgi:hypothetical protein